MIIDLNDHFIGQFDHVSIWYESEKVNPLSPSELC
jgi:hypothetical protein